MDADYLTIGPNGDVILATLYTDEDEQIMLNNKLYNNVVNLIDKINNYQYEL